jgi:hypothetical protein
LVAGGDLPGRKRWAKRLEHKLDQGKVEAVVKTLREFPTPNAEPARLLNNEAEYFERNAERMRYPQFRAQGLFVGSGVVEAGCKTVVGARIKQSGMFWTVRGSNAILALRCNASAVSSRTTGKAAPRPLDLPQICRAPA